MLNFSWLILLCAFVAIGFYCAAKLTNQTPLWVRLIVLAPSFAAMLTIYEVLEIASYTAYSSDLVRGFSFLLLYALIASLFTSRPWLSIGGDDESL